MKIMRSFEPNRIQLEIIDKLMDFWKDYSRIQERIPKNLKGLVLIGQWVKSCVEYKLKNLTIEWLNKSLVHKKEGLENCTVKLQGNASKILRLSEEKEFIKMSLESLNDEKTLKEIRKFIKNKENQKFDYHQKSQKNLKILLKNNREKDILKEEEQVKKEDSLSNINISEELFNLAYKSPHSQDLRNKFLINCPKKNQYNIKIPQENKNENKEKFLKDSNLKLKLENLKLNKSKNPGFLTARNESKQSLLLEKRDERKSSLSNLRKPNEVLEIDDYELNLRENQESIPYSKAPIGGEINNYNSSYSLTTKFCSSACCRNSFRKWC